MSDSEGIWEVERGFWLENADYYREHLDERAVMAFPGDDGVMEGDAIVEGLDGAPRWSSVEMDDRVIRARDGATVLLYVATATREGEDGPYRARCMSVYSQTSDGRHLVAHQQAPL